MEGDTDSDASDEESGSEDGDSKASDDEEAPQLIDHSQNIATTKVRPNQLTMGLVLIMKT